MALHRMYLDQDLRPGTVLVRGDEAQHAARVKRIRPGDPVQVLNGRGVIGHATVGEIGREGRDWLLALQVSRIEQVPSPRPQIRVLSAAPKGSRLTDLIDGLSQAGAASWSFLNTERGAVDPRPAKIDRLRRAAVEASKQCGRAWSLDIGPEASMDAVLRTRGPDVVVADGAGRFYERRGSPEIHLLVGPEGGWSPRELEQARAAGVRVARFGPHAMRVETAAVVAAAVILNAESSA